MLRRTAVASAVTVAMLGVSGGVTARAIGLFDLGATPTAVVPSTTTTTVTTTVVGGVGASTTPAPVVVSREEVVDVYVVVTVPGAAGVPADGTAVPAPDAPPAEGAPAGAAVPPAAPATSAPPETASPTTTRYVPELDPGYEPPSDELPNPVG